MKKRDERALAQLLKIARSRADELRAHLANLDSAKAAAESSIALLAEAVGAEERALGPGAAPLADFGRFLEGSVQKRRALEATRGTLIAQIDSARNDLQEAFAETKKLEHLTETGRRAAARAAHQDDIAAAADLTAMRRRA